MWRLCSLSVPIVSVFINPHTERNSSGIMTSSLSVEGGETLDDQSSSAVLPIWSWISCHICSASSEHDFERETVEQALIGWCSWAKVRVRVSREGTATGVPIIPGVLSSKAFPRDWGRDEGCFQRGEVESWQLCLNPRQLGGYIWAKVRASRDGLLEGGYNCGDSLVCAVTLFLSKFLESFSRSAAAAVSGLEASAGFISHAPFASAAAKTDEVHSMVVLCLRISLPT